MDEANVATKWRHETSTSRITPVSAAYPPSEDSSWNQVHGLFQQSLKTADFRQDCKAAYSVTTVNATHLTLVRIE